MGVSEAEGASSRYNEARLVRCGTPLPAAELLDAPALAQERRCLPLAARVKSVACDKPWHVLRILRKSQFEGAEPNIRGALTNLSRDGERDWRNNTNARAQLEDQEDV